MTFSKRFLLPVLVVLSLLTGCVPNKKIVLMQKDDVNKKDLPKDSVVRTYQLDTFTYRVQPHDLLLVRFESLTPEEYDFFVGQGRQTGNVNMTGGNAIAAGELVDEHGEIPFPVIGKVKVAGLTVFQIRDSLQAIASRYVESPVVKVRLINYRITILGEVGSEGTITLMNNRVSMLEAISQAGGLGELADVANVKLIRQKGATVEVQYVNLLDENFFNSPYYYVHQNDILIVPPLRQRPFRRYFGTNLSLIVSTISLILLAINLTR